MRFSALKKSAIRPFENAALYDFGILKYGRKMDADRPERARREQSSIRTNFLA